VTRTRAADDFTTIRARMEELRQVTRPRAADDFAVIRARIVVLRRERDQTVADERDQTPSGPRLNYQRRNSETGPERGRMLSRPIVRASARQAGA
jgi:hypothetical protein